MIKNRFGKFKTNQRGIAKRIRILGEEHLFRPGINGIMTDVYNAFPKARIEVAINGLL